MKLKIDQNQIEFDYFFFSVIIPKNTKISYIFPMDFTEILGDSPKMIVIAENKKINYKFYFISKFIYWFLEVINNYLVRIGSSGKHPPIILIENRYTIIPRPSYFYAFSIFSLGFLRKKSFFKYIQETLRSLKNNGYNVVDAENQLQKILTLDNKKLNPEEKNIRFKDGWKFFLIVCFLAIAPFIFMYLQGDFRKNSEIIAIVSAISAVILFFGIIIAIFANKRNFLAKLFFILIILIIIANILD